MKSASPTMFPGWSSTRSFPNSFGLWSKPRPMRRCPTYAPRPLTLLYRLLFILYAEDRDLLPVRDSRYDDYSLRKVRAEVRARKERGDAVSGTAARYYHAIDDLCRIIDKGDSSLGLPPYNGGLFDRERAPLLSDIRLGDQVMVAVIDALSFEKTPERPPLYQLPQPECRATRIDLRRVARTRGRARWRWGCDPSEHFCAQGIGQLLYAGWARAPDYRKDA